MTCRRRLPRPSSMTNISRHQCGHIPNMNHTATRARRGTLAVSHRRVIAAKNQPRSGPHLQSRPTRAQPRSHARVTPATGRHACCPGHSIRRTTRRLAIRGPQIIRPARLHRRLTGRGGDAHAPHIANRPRPNLTLGTVRRGQRVRRHQREHRARAEHENKGGEHEHGKRSRRPGNSRFHRSGF